MANPAILAICNRKGGSGKTTTSAALAHLFSERGKRVLAIDLDPQADLTTTLGVSPEETGALEGLLDADLSGRITSTRWENLDLYPASRYDLDGADLRFAREALGADRVARAVEALQEPYDLVLIDSPPTLGILSLLAIVAAQQVIIPSRASALDIKGIARLRDTIEQANRRQGSNVEILGIVLTAVVEGTAIAGDIRKRLQAADLPILQTQIRRTVRADEAPGWGEPVTSYDRACTASRDYESLVDEISSQLGGA